MNMTEPTPGAHTEMMSESGDIPPVRVILWIHARSRSTVLECAIASERSIHVIHEPFARAFYRGEERRCHPKFALGPVVPGCTYRDMQALLEKPYPGKAAVFVKDGVKVLGGRDHYGYIPRGYVHTFMVRHPKPAVLSSYKCTRTVAPTADADTLVDLCIELCDMAPLFELYEYVTEELNQRPIVIDSQDLANSPRETLQKYCSATGLPFSESFLNWEPGNVDHFPDFVKKSPEFRQIFYKKALQSSSFLPSSDSDVDITGLPHKLVQQIDEYTPLYEKMISNKL